MQPQPAAQRTFFPETVEAIERVEANANRDWKDEAMEAIEWCAKQYPEFTASHVWFRLDAMRAESLIEITTHEPRAMGAMMLKALKERIVARTGRFEPSGRRTNHNRPMAIWASRIYRKEGS